MSESDKNSQIIEYTKCPKCGTLFDVSDIDFSDSKGWVQCGDCTEQFDATKHYVNYSALLEQSILANMDGVSTVQSNFSIGRLNIEDTKDVPSFTLSEDVDLLEGAKASSMAPADLEDNDFVIEKKDFITESSAKADSSIEVVAQETSFVTDEYTLTKSRFESDENRQKNKRFDNEVTVTLGNKVNDHDIDIEPGLYRELSGGSKSSWGNSLLLLLALPLVLCLAFILLLQLQNRGLINLIPASIVEKVESTMPFLASDAKQDMPNLAMMHLTATRMERHPEKKGFVNIVIQLTNKAEQVQQYPNLEVTFTDNVGKTIARRVFASDEYLGVDSVNQLKSQESKSITLTFDALPKGSVGYEIRVTRPDK